MSALSQHDTYTKFNTFELAEALGSADAALVVQKLRAWLIHNQAHNQGISHRDGRWWTFSSIKKWCERDFKWLTPRRLRTIMDNLEDAKVIVRRQYGASDFKMSYWYSVNDDVLAESIERLKHNAFVTDDKSSDAGDKSKTVVKEKQIQKHKHSKTQTTTAVQPPADTEADALPGSPNVVVVSPPHPTTREAETGELIIEAEVIQNRHDEGPDDEPALIEASLNQHANDTAPSKVPLKVPVGDDVLRAELVRFGVVPGRITWLTQTYAEADIRYVMAHTRTPAGANITNPPGFLIKELEKGEVGVLALRDQKVLKCEHPSPAPTRFTAPDESLFTDDEREEIALIGFDRFMALRQMNQPLQSNPNFEYA